MNSPRPYDPNKFNISLLMKEIAEKDDKIKELNEKNEKRENECLKFQIKLKTLEDKLTTKQEKEYNVILI